MSVEALSWVLEHSQTKGTTRLVMIAIGNHIAKDSGEGWCYLKTIMHDANCSLASYHRAIDDALALGELERFINDGGTHKTRADSRPNRFRFPMFVESRRGTQSDNPAPGRGTQDDKGPDTQDDDPAGYSNRVPITVTP